MLETIVSALNLSVSALNVLKDTGHGTEGPKLGNVVEKVTHPVMDKSVELVDGLGY